LIRNPRRLRQVFALGVAAVLLAGPALPQDASQPFDRWGVDLAGRNTGVRPGDDFNTYANGTALDRLAIPADRSSYGVDAVISENVQQRLRGLLEAPAAAGGAAVSDPDKARILYQAFTDQPRIEALAATPLGPDLAAVRAAGSREALAALMGASLAGFQASIFNLDIEPDAKSPDRYVANISQSGLGLPDRDYYLNADFAAQKASYRAYVAQMLTLAGWPDAQAQADGIVAFETAIAQASWAREDERDPNKTYNPTTPAELASSAPGFAWADFLTAAGLGGRPKLILQENTAIPRLAVVYTKTPLETLKAWAAFHLADNAAPYLASSFDQANFAFHEGVLQGQPTERARWKRGVTLVDENMGEALGQLYVDKYFPPEAKAKITALVADLRTALVARFQNVDWMSDATKARAVEKLSKLTVKVGYPDHWRDYGRLAIVPGDLYGDVARAKAFDWERQLRRIDGPVDRAEWGMTPQTVNAYYNGTGNEIVFPAAILQSPYFDVGFDAASNYGSIGATIGHEITHGFDDEGRDFDGTGALVNWWTPEDGPKFDARAARLALQYDAYAPYPGAHVNGKLTDGENIADLGGLLIALDAYHHALHGQPAPVIDGLTGDQRFFLAYAQSWRTKRREAALRRQMVSDPHSPEQYRVNGVVRNVDAWYQAFDVKPGDALYLAPADRVRIW
jgi:putative endopeptidase